MSDDPLTCSQCGEEAPPRGRKCPSCGAFVRGPPKHSKETYTEDELLVRYAMRRLGLAREDPGTMFELVVREETSRRRLTLAPHQRVLFDFVSSFHRCVVRMPVGFSKTFSMAALSLFLLGEDNTQRGVVISATQDQAKKPVGMVRDYLEQSRELCGIFPELAPSVRPGDAWTQTALTVDRPPGIRDPSLRAIGLESAVLGSRLSWILVDDILDDVNTRTPASREAVRRWFFTNVMSRRDVKDARVVVTNTPWHPEDLTYVLSEDAHWPTITMNVEGGIYVQNAPGWAENNPHLSPAAKAEHAERVYGAPEYRLAAHDEPDYLEQVYEGELPENDVDEVVPLWPEKVDREAIAQLREDFPAHEFNQSFMCICRDESTAKVKIEWVENCKRLAREREHWGLVHEYRKGYPTFTGVDLAIGQGRKHDLTAFFTFAVLPDQKRLILDALVGRMAGRSIVDKLIELHKRYDSVIRVENNAAQDFLLQWARDADAMLPLRPHTTGKNKADPTHGVESIFIEIEKGLWLIPNDPGGHCVKPLQQWLNECYNYEPPPAHTGDLLMASWFAREQARAQGALVSRPTPQGAISALMAR